MLAYPSNSQQPCLNNPLLKLLHSALTCSAPITMVMVAIQKEQRRFHVKTHSLLLNQSKWQSMVYPSCRWLCFSLKELIFAGKLWGRNKSAQTQSFKTQVCAWKVWGKSVGKPCAELSLLTWDSRAFPKIALVILGRLLCIVSQCLVLKFVLT